ncbi:MAG TPA: hypothetical protein VFS58_16575 [Steroidobacteraceae bacterium]|nr:hypothetical protein [Steroidobacteraceae bacterium]
MNSQGHADVLRVGAVADPAVVALTQRFGVVLRHYADGQDLPGSYWGDSEAGLRGNVLYVRADTPLHSLLHELSHYVCMSPDRRAGLDRDAGGDDAEECAVCYLQILLADELPMLRRARMFEDMDAWGYTFRLGSSRAWFEQDASDACIWLRRNGVVDDNHHPTFHLKT